MALVRRVKAAPGTAAVPVEDGGKGVLSKYPSLAEWLAVAVWPDGSARETGTIMVFCEEGRWKAWLHDRDAGEGCFCSADTPTGLFAALEAMLSTGKGDWRPDKKGGRRGG